MTKAFYIGHQKESGCPYMKVRRSDRHKEETFNQFSRVERKKQELLKRREAMLEGLKLKTHFFLFINALLDLLKEIFFF